MKIKSKSKLKSNKTSSSKSAKSRTSKCYSCSCQQELKDMIAENNPDALFLGESGGDTFLPALIGGASRCGQKMLAIYDIDKIIDILMSEGMPREDAIEYFEFNIIGSWVGENTPLFLSY